MTDTTEPTTAIKAKYRVYYRPNGPQNLGTVESVWEWGVHVKWDNGHFHTYDPTELVVVRAAGEREPSCVRCGADLTDGTPVLMFVSGVPTDALLCVNHGANGANGISAAEFEKLTMRSNVKPSNNNPETDTS